MFIYDDECHTIITSPFRIAQSVCVSIDNCTKARNGPGTDTVEWVCMHKFASKRTTMNYASNALKVLRIVIAF